MTPDQPVGQEAVAAEALDPEPEAPGPPVPALRWLPGDPSPRGRSQSDLSSASSRGRPLRVHISGSGKGGSEWPGVAQGRLAPAGEDRGVAIFHGRSGAAVVGRGREQRAKAVVPTSPPPAGFQRLGVPWLSGRRPVGAPEWVRLSSARVPTARFPRVPLDSRLVVRRQAAPVLALVLGLIWFLG